MATHSLRHSLCNSNTSLAASVSIRSFIGSDLVQPNYNSKIPYLTYSRYAKSPAVVGSELVACI